MAPPRFPDRSDPGAAARPLFIHPSRDLPASEHYDAFVMSLIAGRPSRTALRAARLILTGTPHRDPRLPRLLAHGGGPVRVGA